MERGLGVRAWMTTQAVLMVTWMLFISVAVWVGADALVVVGGGLVVGMAISVVTDPRRPWWGPEVLATMTDPAIRRRNAIRLFLVLAASFVVVPVVVAAVGTVTSS